MKAALSQIQSMMDSKSFRKEYPGSVWSFTLLWYVSGHLCHDRMKWESHSSLQYSSTNPLSLPLSVSPLSHLHANKHIHIHIDPSP